MNAFPEFMKHPANRIARLNQATPGVEGYVFDGNDGSQIAFWTCSDDAVSGEHVHDYDEYMLVVQGCYMLLIEGKGIPINAGEGTSSHGV
jgi:mannose-6-phosphate isomerase-like protein (cupin superfamily)